MVPVNQNEGEAEWETSLRWILLSFMVLRLRNILKSSMMIFIWFKWLKEWRRYKRQSFSVIKLRVLHKFGSINWKKSDMKMWVLLIQKSSKLLSLICSFLFRWRRPRCLNSSTFINKVWMWTNMLSSSNNCLDMLKPWLPILGQGWVSLFWLCLKLWYRNVTSLRLSMIWIFLVS